MMTSFFVSGNPVAKQSFRYSSGHGYTDPRITAWQAVVGYRAREVFTEPIQGAVIVKMFFYMRDKRRVDLDNLSKAVLDACKNIAFGDDCNVTTLVLTKSVRKDNPGVLIVVIKGESA